MVAVPHRTHSIGTDREVLTTVRVVKEARSRLRRRPEEEISSDSRAETSRAFTSLRATRRREKRHDSWFVAETCGGP